MEHDSETRREAGRVPYFLDMYSSGRVNLDHEPFIALVRRLFDLDIVV